MVVLRILIEDFDRYLLLWALWWLLFQPRLRVNFGSGDGALAHKGTLVKHCSCTYRETMQKGTISTSQVPQGLYSSVKSPQ